MRKGAPIASDKRENQQHEKMSPTRADKSTNQQCVKMSHHAHGTTDGTCMIGRCSTLVLCFFVGKNCVRCLLWQNFVTDTHVPVVGMGFGTQVVGILVRRLSG